MRTPCPKCACGEARAVPYLWFEVPLALLLAGPYCCRYCGSRFIRFFGLSGRG
jgi:hypothetical protein